MQTIGIDIGGTSIKGIVIDQQGHIAQEVRLPTEAARGKDHILEHVKSVIEQLLDEYPEVNSIGIGTAGRVNVHTGHIVYATNNLPGWHGFHLKDWCEAQFNRRTVVDNDGNTALLGEHWLGAGRGYSNLTMITLGTGVGGANMVGGELYRGADWNGGEYGHVIFVPHGRPCNCGFQGCIEQYISGTALVRSANEAASASYTSGHEVFTDYVEGVPVIVEVVDEFIRNVAFVLHNIHVGMNPDAILIGGGIVEAKSVWWSKLEMELASMGSTVTVRPALLGNQAGSIGAARYAMLGSEILL